MMNPSPLPLSLPDRIPHDTGVCVRERFLVFITPDIYDMCLTIVTPSFMMMSPMTVWGRKRWQEWPTQLVEDSCTPSPSITTTSSVGRVGVCAWVCCVYVHVLI